MDLLKKKRDRNNIESLRRLLSALRKEELIVLKDQIHVKKTKTNSKTLRLLELVLRNNQISDARAHEVISPNSTFGAFGTLIWELKKKILETLTLNININRAGVFPENIQADIQSKKNLFAARVFMRRGLHEDFRIINDKIIKDTEKYEIFDTLIEALILKFHVLGIRGHKAHVLKSEIDYYKNCKNLCDAAFVLYTEITAKNNFQVKPRETENLKKQFEYLNTSYASYPSETLWYWLKVISVFFFQAEGNYNEAVNNLNQIIVKLHKCKAIKMADRISGTHLRLADNYLYLQEFDKAITHSQLASDLYEKRSLNYCLAQEVRFRANFHLERYGEAGLIMRSLLAIDYRSISPFLYAKWRYYKAAASMFRGDCEEASYLLTQTSALDGDKEGWNISVRILEIMVQITSDKYDHIADQKIINLITFARSLGKKISKRNELIVDVLRELRKTVYNFEKVSHSHDDLLSLLSSNNPKYAWNMTSPELIRFDAWFMAKAKKMEYRYDLVVS